MIDDDDTLLDEWTSSRSEEAFRVLVERRLPHVLAVASRITRSSDLARDVAQQTFVRLAAKPPKLKAQYSLSTWLHLTTRSFAIDLVRSEESRRRRETSFAPSLMPENHTDGWSEIEPVIDDLVAKLPAVEREVVALRFYANQSYSSIGGRLGFSENAARMRVTRALEKLRLLLAKRGIVTTAAVLSGVLPTHACLPASSSLVASISSKAVAGAPSLAVTNGLLSSLFMNAKIITASAISVALFGVLVWQQVVVASLQKDVDESLIQSTVSQQQAGQDERPTRSSQEKVTAALQLARLANPLERAAALAQWAEQFESNEDILAAVEALKNDPEAAPHLRVLIAPHLTRQWATVDPRACLDAFVAAVAEDGGNPFGAPEIRDDSGSYFSLIATTNPEAFQEWSASMKGSLFSALCGDVPLSEFKKIDPHFYPKTGGMALLSSVARFSPDLMMSLVTESKNSWRVRYLLQAGDFYPALLARHGSREALWPLLEKMPASGEINSLFTRLGRESIQADERSFDKVLSEVSQRESGPRLRFEMNALGERLAQLAKNGDKEDEWWESLNAFGETINSNALADDQSYDGARSQMAVLALKGDFEGAVKWVESIVRPDQRVQASMKVAATLDSKGRYEPSNLRIAEYKDEWVITVLSRASESAPPLHVVLSTLTLSPELSSEEMIGQIRTSLEKGEISDQLKAVKGSQ